MRRVTWVSPWAGERGEVADERSNVGPRPVAHYNRDMTVHVPPRSAAEGRVVSNPAILGGRPVFSGTRVPVASLFDYLADGLTLDYFLESFPTVPREQAVAVLLYGLGRIEQDLG